MLLATENTNIWFRSIHSLPREQLQVVAMIPLDMRRLKRKAKVVYVIQMRISTEPLYLVFIIGFVFHLIYLSTSYTAINNSSCETKDTELSPIMTGSDDL